MRLDKWRSADVLTKVLILQVAVIIFLFIINILLNGVLPTHQSIGFSGSIKNEPLINPSLFLLLMGVGITISMIMLSLVREPFKWFGFFFFCVWIVFSGRVIRDELNVLLDRSEPLLTQGEFMGVVYEGSWKYRHQFLKADLSDHEGHKLQISTRYYPRMTMVQIHGSQVSFYLCNGFFGEAYICLPPPSKEKPF